MPPVTIKDIAKTSGLSIATVSYVINKSRPVSPDAAERVNQAIYQLGYTPNLVARSLRSKRTRTIGLIVPDSSNPFFAEIAKGVEDAGFSASYSVILCNSNATLDREQVYLDLLVSKRVDGLILASTSASLDHLLPILQRQLPVVVFYRQAGDLPIDTIQVDNQRGGQDATRHLIRFGHKKIACICPASEKTPSYHRVDGYLQAMQEHGLLIEPELMPQGNNRIEGGHAAAIRLLDSGRQFSAIFSTNDAMAIGAMRALRERGLRVPHDVSVIGFDDILLASYVAPALTTIAQPKVEAGKRAVEFLIERIEACGQCEPQHLVLETTLIERASTAPAP
jgi:LacI family transcriptional regulator